MSQDHVFIDLVNSSTDPRDGRILEIACVRTDRKGALIKAFTSTTADIPFETVLRMLRDTILNKQYDNKYIVVAHNSEFKRVSLRHETELAKESGELFSGRIWIDLSQLVWPLLLNNMIPSRSLEAVAKHFGVAITDESDTAKNGCTMLVHAYWKLMRRYKTALLGEEAIREIGGENLESLRKLIGF